MPYTQPHILDDVNAAAVIKSGNEKNAIASDHPGESPTGLVTDSAYEADE